MKILTALIIAAAISVLFLLCIVGIVVYHNFSQILSSKNSKKAIFERLLADESTPLHSSGLRREIRKAFERVLVPLRKADKSALPARMDRTFRSNIERQLELLNQRKLYRDIRLTDVTPKPKNQFTHWEDDGREWREAMLECTSLERYVTAEGGNPVYQIYRPFSNLYILQSRHVRSSDRKPGKNSYYAGQGKITCPSCGAPLELNSQRIECPYCGGVIHSDFYDWQTESFELYAPASSNSFLVLGGLALLLFVSMFFCFLLIPNMETAFGVGLFAAVGLLVLVTDTPNIIKRRQKKLSEQVVNYSEHYLRSCIAQALQDESDSPDLMDRAVGTLLLKKVVNAGDITKVTVKAHISEVYLPQRQKPYTKKYRRTFTMQRARNPEERKADGALFVEKECPSCGANFVPDENHCCSFCGYALQHDRSKWVMEKVRT